MIRLVFIFIVCLACKVQAVAQSCDCPTDCAPCAGAIIQYTLQYQGGIASEVVVKDQANVIFKETLISGEEFTLKGMLAGGRFAGNKLFLYIDGEEDTQIDVLCTSNTAVNSAFGSFVIVKATRLDGKAICCPPGNKKDLIAPIFSDLPPDILISTDPLHCSAVATWQEPVAKDCNLTKVASDWKSGDEFPIGSTTVTYEAIDLAGNTSLYSFTVTVSDNSAPVIASCSENIEVTTYDPNGMIVLWPAPGASDNCAVKSFVSSHTGGALFPVGRTTVVFTATDQSGNVATCAFEVTVTLLEEPSTPEFPSPPVEEPVDIVIGKLITPDGDGKNDEWIIENIARFADSRVQVFDRWGSVIFSASGYNNESVVWRGNSSGSGKLAAGTYFYVITYSHNGVDRERKGFIELIP